MTVVVHGVIRLWADDDPAAWPSRFGDLWARHVDCPIGELHFMPGWTSVMGAFRNRRYFQLDWGTVAWEVSVEELRRLIGHRPADDPIFLRLERQQERALDLLDPTARYLLYAMEC